MRKKKLLLVVQGLIFREGLERLLQQCQQVQLLPTCSTISQAVSITKINSPDILILDSQLLTDNSGGLKASIQKKLSFKNLIIITSASEMPEFFALLEAGATGFISKECSFESLNNAIDLVSEGWLIVEPSLSTLAIRVLQHSHQRLFRAKPANVKLLSNKEKQVLRLMTRYRTNKEIAQVTFTTESTIKAHIRNILRKLEARDRREAVICAVEQGINTIEN
jgi:DNA-binding NarL/FixJ family response regulator